MSDARDTLARLGQLETARTADWPALIARLDPNDRLVANRLDRLRIEGTPTQRLAASLATLDPGLPGSGQRLLCPDAGTRRPRISVRSSGCCTGDRCPVWWTVWSGTSIAEVPPPPEDDRETRDRRRANAACALILLDRGDRGWSLLRLAPR